MVDDPRLLGEDWWREHALTSFLGMPIVLQDRLLGVVALCGRAPFRLDADEKELLESFVAQAAVAIRNAGLYAQTAQRLEQTRASSAWRRSSTPPSSLDACSKRWRSGSPRSVTWSAAASSGGTGTGCCRSCP